jgi:molybdopterin/thiamine biosynthesis adenylyltransferase
MQVTKNLVLAGVGLIHLVDNATLSTSLPPENFIIPYSDALSGSSLVEQCALGLQEMNPLVDVRHDNA